MKNTIKELRMYKELTVANAANISKVPIRTYIRYENDDNYGNELKREMIINALLSFNEVSEDRGILTIDQIKKATQDITAKYENKITYCYLFGSYSKGKAKENSDVDICVDTTLCGMEFVGLIEDFRVKLNKRVDIIRLNDLKDNFELVKEILKDGVKIYG